MNYRTLTNNPQATELIQAVRELRPVKQPDNYAASLEYLQADNASYCQLIAKYGPGQESPSSDWQMPNLSPYVAFTFGVLLLLILIKKLCQSSAKSGKIG